MTTRTWCDGHGAWHCEVTLPETGNRRGASDTAAAAIRDEIRERNPHDLLTGLRFVDERSDGANSVTHWREEDGT